MDSAAQPSAAATPPLSTTSEDDNHTSQEDHNVTTTVDEEYETTCWGCGLRLLLTPYTPLFKCGWCGAVSNHDATKNESTLFWWRRLRDRCLVSLLFAFILFTIYGGIWAVYPVAFSVSYWLGVFHCCLAVFLSITTLSTFFLSAFCCPGAQPIIPWGSYPIVGKGNLDNYSFCLYCSKPKSPRSHHCRTCRMCVMDMDHHCPFIGNCVGSANHRCFIVFLISSVSSTTYLSIISVLAAYRIWPPILHRHVGLYSAILNDEIVSSILMEILLPFFRSTMYLSTRCIVLAYLLIASVSVEIGLSVLLWQQLWYIYEGKTYLSSLNSEGNEGGGGGGGGGGEAVERDFQNFVRFFGCNYPTFRHHLPSFWNSRKRHKK